jgi:hypothetical protein
MGSGPPLFDGRNFSYWKSRMGAYLDALSPNVWNATKTPGLSLLSNKSGMLRLEMQLSKVLVRIFLLGLIILILLMICGFN